MPDTSRNTEKPVLLVTCSPGNITLCIHEIGNVLFRLDQDVRIEPSRYPGLIMVFSKLDPVRAYRVSTMREYGFVENIVPVMCYFEEIPERELLKKCIDELISKSGNVKIKVKARGVRGVSTFLFQEVKELLALRNIYHDPASSTCLYVEVVDGKTFIGLGHCRPVFKYSY